MPLSAHIFIFIQEVCDWFCFRKFNQNDLKLFIRVGFAAVAGGPGMCMCVWACECR